MGSSIAAMTAGASSGGGSAQTAAQQAAQQAAQLQATLNPTGAYSQSAQPTEGAIGQGVFGQSANQGTSYAMGDDQNTAYNAPQNNINNSSLENNMVNTTVGTTPSQVGDTSPNMEGGTDQNNFSPQALQAGKGIYGSEIERQKSLYARQHGLNPANQRYSRDTYRGNPNWSSPWSLKNPLINTF